MTAVWLLPVVTLVVASSTGGLVARALHPHSVTLALITTAFSFVMVLIGLSLALMIITVYLLRLITYGAPDTTLILSAFIVLGEHVSFPGQVWLLMPLVQGRSDRAGTLFWSTARTWRNSYLSISETVPHSLIKPVK